MIYRVTPGIGVQTMTCCGLHTKRFMHLSKIVSGLIWRNPILESLVSGSRQCRSFWFDLKRFVVSTESCTCVVHDDLLRYAQ
jgi:hypothetical protein